jgi:hypothetical protein
LFRKSRDGAAEPAVSVALDAEGGRPLDNGVASRMGGAFGRDFSNVRIHTDADAAAAATSMNARAFTVGHDIAFAGGEYAPGTIIGDALLAHELAHVAQQDGAAEVLTQSEAATGALEHDADDAAVHAVTSLWPGLRRFARDTHANAMPRLKSSLKLQRCDASPSELQEYLRVLDKTKKIEDNNDSDGKARQIAEAWSKGDTQYILTVRRKKLLIEEMIDGYVSPDDQEQILNLLERSWGNELKQMIGPNGVPHKKLLDEFGWHKEELWSFYMRRYTSAYPPDVQKAIDSASEAPKPQKPDPAKLDAVQDPSTNPFRMVQLGDELPKTTQTDDVGTKRTGKDLDKDTAAQWVAAEYGPLVSPETATRVRRTQAHKYNPVDFAQAYIGTCKRYWLEKRFSTLREQRDPANQAEALKACSDEEPFTAGFHDPADDTISISQEREAPSTMVHEVLHAYANPRVHELGQFATEGLTEYLTRRVILRHQHTGGEKPLYIGGHYDDAYDAILELAVFAGEDLLARVHFQGAVTELCTAMGKARFDAWNKAMEIRGNGEAATKILRGETPVQPSTEPCT